MADHRQWGGNKPTSADGDPSWPRESLASHIIYGDKGGRAKWPLSVRLRLRVRNAITNIRRRFNPRWYKENGWWYFR